MSLNCKCADRSIRTRTDIAKCENCSMPAYGGRVHPNILSCGKRICGHCKQFHDFLDAIKREIFECKICREYGDEDGDIYCVLVKLENWINGILVFTDLYFPADLGTIIAEYSF